MAASKDKARAILSYATPNPVGPYRLVTPPSPDLGRKTQTPVMPVMGGPLVNLPAPVMPTKQVTPVAPPLPGRLVNVPTQQGRVVDRSTDDAIFRIPKVVYDEARYKYDSQYWQIVSESGGPKRSKRGAIWELDLNNVADSAAWRYIIRQTLENMMDEEHAASDSWRRLPKATRDKYASSVREALEASKKQLEERGATPDMISGAALDRLQQRFFGQDLDPDD